MQREHVQLRHSSAADRPSPAIHHLFEQHHRDCRVRFKLYAGKLSLTDCEQWNAGELQSAARHLFPNRRHDSAVPRHQQLQTYGDLLVRHSRRTRERRRADDSLPHQRHDGHSVQLELCADQISVAHSREWRARRLQSAARNLPARWQSRRHVLRDEQLRLSQLRVHRFDHRPNVAAHDPLSEQSRRGPALRFELRAGILSAADRERRRARPLHSAIRQLPARRHLQRELFRDQWLRAFDEMRFPDSRDPGTRRAAGHPVPEQSSCGRAVRHNVRAGHISAAIRDQWCARKLQRAPECLSADRHQHDRLPRHE